MCVQIEKDKEETKEEEVKVSKESMRLELEEKVLQLLQASIISMPFLNWDPE